MSNVFSVLLTLGRDAEVRYTFNIGERQQVMWIPNSSSTHLRCFYVECI